MKYVVTVECGNIDFIPGPNLTTLLFGSGLKINIPNEYVVATELIQDPLPTVTGTAIWANTKDDPQANLEAFILTGIGRWFNAKSIDFYQPEDIASWKPYSDHTPQPYD